MSCGSKDQILGVPMLKSGRGCDEADAVVAALREWNLIDHVVAMCFDTTSSNCVRLNRGSYWEGFATFCM